MVLGCMIIMNLMTAVALNNIEDLDSKSDMLMLEHGINQMERENQLWIGKQPYKILINGDIDNDSSPPKV